jgi:hypothetical protein
MNTAPQDDYSGDLARDLSGWSDDALLKELSRRTTITTDADHELVSTGAGLHLQHRRESLSIVYDSGSKEFTVTLPPIAMNGIHADDGLSKVIYYPLANPLVFDKYSSNYEVLIVANTDLFSIQQLYWTASIDSADACSDATTLAMLSPNLYGCTQNLEIIKITLKADGTYSHTWRWQYPDAWLPNLKRPGSLPYLTYRMSDRKITLHNIQGRTGTLEQNAPFSMTSDPVPKNTSSAYIYAGALSDTHNAVLFYDGHPDISDMQTHAAVVGRITTDDDGRGRLDDWSCSLQLPISFAYTGEITPDAKLTVNNGIISALPVVSAGVSDDVDLTTASTLYFQNGILTSHT